MSGMSVSKIQYVKEKAASSPSEGNRITQLPQRTHPRASSDTGNPQKLRDHHSQIRNRQKPSLQCQRRQEAAQGFCSWSKLNGALAQEDRES